MSARGDRDRSNDLLAHTVDRCTRGPAAPTSAEITTLKWDLYAAARSRIAADAKRELDRRRRSYFEYSRYRQSLAFRIQPIVKCAIDAGIAGDLFQRHHWGVSIPFQLAPKRRQSVARKIEPGSAARPFLRDFFGAETMMRGTGGLGKS
jgi:hypothetical protein